MTEHPSRRRFVKESLGIPAAIAAGLSFEHQALLAQLVDRKDYGKAREPVKGLQQGRFGEQEVSRLIIGGNLISGSAHAGDLVYQSALMTHYFTDEKIMETWAIAEQNGINSTLMRADPHIVRNYQAYRKRGGRLHWIAQSAPEQGDPVENARMARDSGAYAVYYHGGKCDTMVREGKIDEVGEIVEGMKKTGIFAGLGGHRLETIRASEEAGIDPDFYMYTVNRVDYLSSDPDEIESFMKTVQQPWIGFKVLGAGREKQLQEGFVHAFARGADFIAVGMFDWQVRDDTALVQEILAKGIDRPRPWRY
ncbi:MAG: hypothetical protein JXQ83_13200 [Candidatus Glassbacteria bacterium]|nr:hypothetical protein [Candidatus Glassbacteria bacterium]